MKTLKFCNVLNSSGNPIKYTIDDVEVPCNVITIIKGLYLLAYKNQDPTVLTREIVTMCDRFSKIEKLWEEVTDKQFILLEDADYEFWLKSLHNYGAQIFGHTVVQMEAAFRNIEEDRLFVSFGLQTSHTMAK